MVPPLTRRCRHELKLKVPEGSPHAELPFVRDSVCRFGFVIIYKTVLQKYTIQNKLRTNCSQTRQRQSFELNDLKF